MSVAGAVFRVGASILVALLIFEGASSVFGPGLSHLVPTWFTRLSRFKCCHGLDGPATGITL